MSGRFVRASSFRHVFGDQAKPADCYQQLSINFNGDGGHVCGNGKYIAFSYGGSGGAVQVLSSSQTGRIEKSNPRISHHKAKVLDCAFSPFVDNVIATVGEDNYCHVVQFAHFETVMTDVPANPTATLKGHQKKVGHLEWHPTASNILGTVSYDNTIKIWDVEAQAEAYNVDLGGEALYMNWNTDGSLFCSTSKGASSKILTITDPRASGSAQTVPIFEGTKNSRALWADNQGKIIVVGFTKSATRQYALYDPKSLDKPLVVQDIDQGSGLMIPHYDPDTSMLYLAGKGDSSVKYFELVNEAPYLHFLSEFSGGSSSQKGMGFLPKRVVDVSKCEVMSTLRVLRDSLEPVHFCVPRKSDLFQGDIFPDCYAGEATNDNKGYMSGSNTAPKLMSLDPDKQEGGRKEVVMAVKKSPDELQKELDAALARIKELEAEVARLKK